MHFFEWSENFERFLGVSVRLPSGIDPDDTKVEKETEITCSGKIVSVKIPHHNTDLFDLKHHARDVFKWSGAKKAAFQDSMRSRFATEQDMEHYTETVEIELPFECHVDPIAYDFNVSKDSGLVTLWADFKVHQAMKFKKLKFGQYRGEELAAEEEKKRAYEESIRRQAYDQAYQTAQAQREAERQAHMSVLQQQAVEAMQKAQAQAQAEIHERERAAQARIAELELRNREAEAAAAAAAASAAAARAVIPSPTPARQPPAPVMVIADEARGSLPTAKPVFTTPPPLATVTSPPGYLDPAFISMMKATGFSPVPMPIVPMPIASPKRKANYDIDADKPSPPKSAKTDASSESLGFFSACRANGSILD